MNKINSQKDFISIVQLVLVGLMFVGLLFSRAVLSMSMIGAIIVGFSNIKELKNNWRLLKKHPVFIIISILFFLHLLSIFWVKDIAYWTTDIQLKLPYLLFPFAMLALPLQDINYKANALLVMQSILIAGIFYSIYVLVFEHWHLFVDGKHFGSPMDGDYLRFSILLISITNISIFHRLQRNRNSISYHKLRAYIDWSFIIIAFLYIHLQSSKLGLIALYSLFLFLGILFIVKRGLSRKMYAAIVILLLIMLSTFKFVPGFTEQLSGAKVELVALTNYEKEEIDDSKMSSFVPRIITYQTAIDLIKERPILGVGAGGVFPAMKEVYKEKYPDLIKLTVHNQPLNTAVGLGIPAAILMIVMLFYPLFLGGSKFEKANALIFVIACVVEAMLEVQNGIFIYLFFTFWWIKESLSTNVQDVSTLDSSE